MGGMGGMNMNSMGSTMNSMGSTMGSTMSGVMDGVSKIDFAGHSSVCAEFCNRTLGSCGKLSQSSHPAVCLFHMLFKGLALFFYLFGGWFTKDKDGKGPSFIVITVICMLLLAADFWVVKNITGRLLVGLRWWNKVEGDNTTWVFESHDEEETDGQGEQVGMMPRRYNNFDKTVFWTALYITPIVWLVLLFFGILRLKLSWLIIVFMALGLSLSNVYGYWKCSKEQKGKFDEKMKMYAQQGAMFALRSTVFDAFASSPAPQQQQQQGQNFQSQQQQPAFGAPF